MNNQAKVIVASFIYFATVMEKNEIVDDIPKGLKKLFRKVAWISEKYSKHLELVTNEINEILKDVDKEIDFMLISVSLISEYYEQMKGKKRLFTPMSYAEIVDIQDECIELNNKNANSTFDVCEILVRGLLNENK